MLMVQAAWEDVSNDMKHSSPTLGSLCLLSDVPRLSLKTQAEQRKAADSQTVT